MIKLNTHELQDWRKETMPAIIDSDCRGVASPYLMKARYPHQTGIYVASRIKLAVVALRLTTHDSRATRRLSPAMRVLSSLPSQISTTFD